MSLLNISEKFVLNKLKNLKKGNLRLVNYDGKVFHFGDLESSLTADIQINNNRHIKLSTYSLLVDGQLFPSQRQ